MLPIFRKDLGDHVSRISFYALAMNNSLLLDISASWISKYAKVDAVLENQ